VAAEPQSQYVLLHALRFHYLDWGNETARPLVLLHGYTSHAHSWDTFARAMQQRFHVLALDQRGHGETGWTSDYSAQAMIEDVRAFAHALRLDTFALLGLSMGGRNAYGFAAAHPGKVERLVIVDIGPEVVAGGSARIRAGSMAKDVFDSPEEAFRAQRAANARPPEAEQRRRVLYNLMRTEDGRWTWRYDKALRSPDRPLPWPAADVAWVWLTKIPCPTLLVRGAESDVLSVETAERMERVLPNGKLVTVPAAGHPVPLDNPPGFLEAVQTFLRSA
jgi:pimeloyl-ACP methyl ester carboxylesterase